MYFPALECRNKHVDGSLGRPIAIQLHSPSQVRHIVVLQLLLCSHFRLAVVDVTLVCDNSNKKYDGNSSGISPLGRRMKRRYSP